MKLILVQPRLVQALPAHEPTRNFAPLAQLLASQLGQLAAEDIVLLPEHVVDGLTRADYAHGIGVLAQQLGCHIVGGSQHELRADGERVNAGVVSDPTGRVIGEYEKLRPYASERGRVRSGDALGEVTIAGRRLLILICADFWFSDVFQRAHALPDLVLVPAYSVSRKPTPDYSQALWRHLAVARAYEFGVYVGISDWAHTSMPGSYSPSGVAGLADPTTSEPAQFFTPLAQELLHVFELDFDKLAAFRADRLARGFFWKRETP